MNLRSDHLSGNLIPPQAPPELRQRVLSAARQTMGQAAPRDLWTRIWESRPIRLAWAASIGALIFGHLVIGGAVSAGPAQPAIPLAAAVGADDELAEIIDLQHVTVDLPRWELVARDAPSPTDTSTESEDLS